MSRMERMDGMVWDGYHRSYVLNNDCPTKRSSTVMLDVKMADFALFLHPGVLFVVSKEEHLMVLFSSYGWYPKYRVVPETSGLPEISGNTRCFGLPATWWFLKLIGSGRVSREIPGSGSGSGTRWALQIEQHWQRCAVKSEWRLNGAIFYNSPAG